MHTKRHTRFCGIDIAKAAHVACIIDRDGNTLARPGSFRNNADGYNRLLKRLSEAGGSQEVMIGMEATGHYWQGLHEFLTGRGYDVAVINPIQTAQQAKKGIRTAKTDKIDSHSIAVLLRNGDYKPAIVPGDLALTCRQLTRLRYVLIDHSAQFKQVLWSRLHPVWPEYEALFADPFSPTGRCLLQAAPVPQDVLAMSEEDLTELLRKASRCRYGPAKAGQIRQTAVDSVGMRRGLDAARVGIRTLLASLDALRPIRRQLEDQIKSLAERLPPYLLTVPGMDTIKAVSFFGETDPISAFRRPDQLVAFAGLDLGAWQTGQFTAPKRHISKRGSPYLRRTLWHMAHQAVYQEGQLREYWLQKRRQGLPHISAVTAASIKICRLCWRILTDQRDYVPEGRPTSPVTGS